MYRTDKQFMKNPATAAARIYIGFIPKTVVSSDLEEKFKVHGKILGLVQQQGFAFIQYENEFQAENAIQRENFTMLHGRKITVKHAMDKSQQKPGGGNFQQNNNRMNNQGGPPPQSGGQFQPPPPNLSGSQFQNNKNQQQPPPPPSQGRNNQSFQNDNNKKSQDQSPNQQQQQSPINDRNNDKNNTSTSGGPGGRPGGGGGGEEEGVVPPAPPAPSSAPSSAPAAPKVSASAPPSSSPASSSGPASGVAPLGARNSGPPNINKSGPGRQEEKQQQPHSQPPPRGLNFEPPPPPMDGGRGRKRRMRSQDRFMNKPMDMMYGREDQYYAPPPPPVGPPGPPRSYVGGPGGPPPPVLDQPDRNDCEIIVVSKSLTKYAEYIEQRLKSIGLIVDLLFPNEDVPIGRVLANISSRGCLYAILVMPVNEEHRSLTLNILHGLPQEHRNMPVEDALILMARNFDAYMRGDKTASETLGSGGTMNISDRHPTTMQLMLNLLAENRQITTGQYDRLLKYLQDRREIQHQHEVEEGVDQDSLEGNSKQTELQNRIMNILNNKTTSDGGATTGTGIVTEKLSITGSSVGGGGLITPTSSITADESTAKSESPLLMTKSDPAPQAADVGADPPPLLKDPSVQKALDSLLGGDLLKGMF